MRKYFNIISKIFSIFIIILFLIVFIKVNKVHCDDNDLSIHELYLLNNLKKELLNGIITFIHDPELINRYGTNALYPNQVTFFYSHYIENITYINAFLDKLPLIDIFNKKHFKDEQEALTYIINLYIEHVIKAQKAFENFFHLLIASKVILAKIELNSLQQIANNYYLPHFEATANSHIITAEAHRLFNPINDVMVNFKNNTPNKIGCVLAFDGDAIEIKLVYVFKVFDIPIPMINILYKIPLK